MIDLKATFGLITEAEYADIRDVSPGALANERYRGLGPPFTKIGRHVYYPIKGIKADIAKNTRAPKPRPTMVSGSPKYVPLESLKPTAKARAGRPRKVASDSAAS